jgi:hypothetical protein
MPSDKAAVYIYMKRYFGNSCKSELRKHIQVLRNSGPRKWQHCLISAHFVCLRPSARGAWALLHQSPLLKWGRVGRCVGSVRAHQLKRCLHENRAGQIGQYKAEHPLHLCPLPPMPLRPPPFISILAHPHVVFLQFSLGFPLFFSLSHPPPPLALQLSPQIYFKLASSVAL